MTDSSSRIISNGKLCHRSYGLQSKQHCVGKAQIQTPMVAALVLAMAESLALLQTNLPIESNSVQTDPGKPVLHQPY
ncbi:hypothetical protein V2J09_014319 [Rumex salicifolius]